ncbi:MAG: hypothetical protein Q9M50_12990 [Methylococcales bacterium]|nr:hypothetical protein [Methylococcales bacterium]
MSIINQLRNEANLKQETEFAETTVQQQQDQAYQELILPKMQKTFTFLKEIIGHLGYLEKAIEIEDYSQKFPEIGGLTQQDYQINTDGYSGFSDFDKIKQINVTFVCVGKGSFDYGLEGRSRIESEVAFLHSKNIAFDWNQFVNKNGVDAAQFTITRKIPVRFRFEADTNHSKIKLLINNHEDFNVYSKAFDPDEINDELLDEVIRFMLRKDSDFIRLDINNQDKLRIQKKAEALQMQQAQWLEEINVEEQEVATQDTHSSKFFSRINLFTKQKK